jgi:hypothetical protein
VLLVPIEVVALAATFLAPSFAGAFVLFALGPIAAILVLVALLVHLFAAGFGFTAAATEHRRERARHQGERRATGETRLELLGQPIEPLCVHRSISIREAAPLNRRRFHCPRQGAGFRHVGLAVDAASDDAVEIRAAPRSTRATVVFVFLKVNTDPVTAPPTRIAGSVATSAVILVLIQIETLSPALGEAALAAALAVLAAFALGVVAAIVVLVALLADLLAAGRDWGRGAQEKRRSRSNQQ